MFICKNCGYGSGSWLGKCPDCGQWNTLTQRDDFDESSAKGGKRSKEKVKKLEIKTFKKIDSSDKKRFTTGIFEFDRVMGGGIVPGEAIFLAGEPGIGKSTLLIQALQNLKTLYISGEESLEQVNDRAERLKIHLDKFSFSDTLQVEGIVEGLEEIKNTIDLIVIDSIQTIYSKKTDSAPGTVSQLKESSSALITFSKKNKIPIILIGHVTKEGDIAGPKTLEHMVDCVLNFEGEKVSNFRVLRATKNRFGSTDEIGIFEMKNQGLIEVKNPLVFLEEEKNIVPGKAIVGVVEGKRPLFFEIQTLTVPTVLTVPRRVVKGVDYNKVLLLLAVLRKNLGLPLDKFDIYVNVVGGVSIKSTAVDLGIIASLISSIKNVVLPSRTVFTGEVGLLGEIRKVFLEDKIIKEAKRLRFTKVISPSSISHIKDLRKFISL